MSDTERILLELGITLILGSGIVLLVRYIRKKS
jgi:hypothetical protein